MEKETSNKRFKILLEDNHLLVVSKPAGLLSQGDISRDKSLIDYAKAYIKKKYDKPGDVFLGLPHRLDRPVSGAIVLCRTTKALKRVTETIRKKEMNKTYLALCVNPPEKHAAKLVSYIKKNKQKNKAIISDKPFSDAKEAILNYKMLGTKKSKTLLRVQLITGRPHQIRAQLNEIKCPIVGDMKYFTQNPLPDKSIALHSYELSFIHPVTKEWLELRAPVPKTEWWYPFKSMS